VATTSTIPEAASAVTVGATRRPSRSMSSFCWRLASPWGWRPGSSRAHRLGALDFAGGTVVHIGAGFAGLAAAIAIGRRLGIKPGQPIEANNAPLVLLGAALLWFGWFG
jgi:ammonia channel protein AmtB